MVASNISWINNPSRTIFAFTVVYVFVCDIVSRYLDELRGALGSPEAADLESHQDDGVASAFDGEISLEDYAHMPSRPQDALGRLMALGLSRKTEISRSREHSIVCGVFLGREG